LVMVISIGFLVPKAAAQSDKYSRSAPRTSISVNALRALTLAPGNQATIPAGQSSHSSR
jgi:hypothetical protein